MFFIASILQNAIIKTSNGFPIGKVSFVAVDPSQGKIVGLVFTQGFFTKQVFVIVPKHIVTAGDGVITVPNPEVVDPIDEIIRARNVYQARIDFFGIPAISESGQSLGYCKDFLIDRESFFIHRFYIQDGATERIFNRDNVIGVINKKLVVKDDAVKQKIQNRSPSPILKPAISPA